jgi:hypothetical protein
MKRTPQASSSIVKIAKPETVTYGSVGGSSNGWEFRRLFFFASCALVDRSPIRRSAGRVLIMADQP